MELNCCARVFLTNSIEVPFKLLVPGRRGHLVPEPSLLERPPRVYSEESAQVVLLVHDAEGQKRVDAAPLQPQRPPRGQQATHLLH